MLTPQMGLTNKQIDQIVKEFNYFHYNNVYLNNLCGNGWHTILKGKLNILVAPKKWNYALVYRCDKCIKEINSKIIILDEKDMFAIQCLI